MHRGYSCDICTACCTFEAMQMCQVEYADCPVIQKLESGEIVDRRPDDFDPSFPSEFSYNPCFGKQNGQTDPR